ncbi:putative GTP-binding protein 6 [Diachasma alloeum]|uniref:putative GTP-binding protein 6 n=1 Tax=Diachasma alloeum TaxID=454923 RepID=UPI0007382A0E|nr:putative GTP-binding protein 6 [Diachasma alloeum]
MISIYKLRHVTQLFPFYSQKKCLESAFTSKIPQKSWTISRFISESSEKEKLPLSEINLDSEYTEISRQYLNPNLAGHGALVIQPHIKHGRNKRKNTTADLQLQEAVALIETLNNWSVVEAMRIGLMSLKKNSLFGKGNLEMLRDKVRKDPNITAVFISINLLRHVQVTELQSLFGVPVYDRYSIVIQIFREHAKTTEAKLQVALAELPYIWKKISLTEEDTGGKINLSESRRMVLHAREAKLKNSLKKLREHRKMIRSSRTIRDIPSVAVVGYTNAGKTCLIKALTGDESLVPENKLFATLDTTAHAGLLPCRLKVLYMDTIGFIQDIPEDLIEPFVATFEDAILADVIVHVFDASHPDKEAQIEHVRETLARIMIDLKTKEKPLIEVANKCDLIPSGTVPENILGVSAVNSTGIDLLRQQIERELLSATARTSMVIRVKSGSSSAAWLYKEITVTNAEADPENPEYILLRVVATELQLHRFRKFLKNK